MATSGTIKLYTSEDSPTWEGRIKWSSSANASTMKTTVSYSVQIRATGSTASSTITQYVSGWVSFYNDWIESETKHDFSSKKITTSSTSWKTVYSDSFTISHSKNTGKAPSILVDGSVHSDVVAFYVPRGSSISVNAIPLGATISSAPNFTDEENPTIVYSNKAGSNATLLQACISLTGATDDIAYRDIDVNGTSYTFELTEEERNILRNATLDGSTSRTVRFYVKSTVSGTTYTKYLDKTFTVANCMPEIHSTFYDVNEKTVALTQNSDIFILGASDLQFQVEATPKKGATITGYNTICGEKSSTLQQSTFYWVEASEITFTCTDNRGQTATLTLPFETIDYARPTCNLELGELTIDEAGGNTASLPLTISGEFFNTTFGADGVQNEIAIELKHTGTNDEWVTLTDGLVPIIEGNAYSLSITARGLDYTKQLTVQARVTDKATAVESVEQKVRLIPVFDWGESDFNFNVPVSFQGQQMADFVIETGTTAMGSNGTWYWEKWKSGKAECWGCRNYGNMAITESFSGMYSSPDFEQDLPSIFTDAPHVMSIDVCGTDDGFVFVMKQSNPSASSSGIFIVCRPTSKTVPQVHISFHAIGRWK